MVAVAIMVPIVVAAVVPVSVVVIVVVISVIVMVAMALGRVGLVEVVVSIETAASMAVATPEGQEDCGTVEEHKPSLQLLLIVWTYFRLHQVFASITVMRHIPIIPKAMLIPVFLFSIFPINTGTMMTRAVRSIDKAMTKRRRLMFTVFRSSSLAVLYPAISQSPLPIISIMAATINAKLMITTTIIQIPIYLSVFSIFLITLAGTPPTIVQFAIHTLLEFRIHNCSFLLFPLCIMLYQGTELLENAADVCRAFGFFFLHPSFLHFALTDVGDEIGHFLVREAAYGAAPLSVRESSCRLCG